MAGETGNGQLNRLHAELDELTGRPAAGLPPFIQAISSAAETMRARAEPAMRPVRERINPATIGGLGVAAVSAIGWLLSRRHQRRTRRVAAPVVPGPAASQPRFAQALHEPAPRVAAPAERVLITATPPGEVTDITRNFMLAFVLPIWQLASLGDWLCHRRARIADNAGSKESMIHLMMLAEASVPVIAGTVLEVTSPVLLMMFAAVALHAVTRLWDVSYAAKHRTVSPLEQHVHSYLEMVPVMATGFVAVLHWPELRALLGLGDRAPDWSLRLKAKPLSTWAVATLLTSIVVFDVLPYVEELRRSRQHGH